MRKVTKIMTFKATQSPIDFKPAVQYMKHFIYHSTSILHELIRTHKWPAPNVSGFITQLVRASHRYREVTGSNSRWSQMPPFQHCYFFADLAAEMERNSKKVHRGAFKSKREGYALYNAGHVLKVKFNHTIDEHFCFIESRVKASMTRNKLYRTRVSLSKQLTVTVTAQVKSGACNCKAGANGRCKNIGALLYRTLHFAESEVNELTCTETHNRGTYHALILQRRTSSIGWVISD